MNSLVLLPSELTSDNTAELKAERARALQSEQQLEQGSVLRVAVLNGRLGEAEVLSLSADRVELKLRLSEPTVAQEATQAIIALPRPQTFKKCLSLGATLGFEALNFIRTQNVIKSYFSSKSLEEQAIQSEILKGLEQSCQSLAPAVQIHEFFKPFVTFTAPELISACSSPPLLLIADTESAQAQNLSQFNLREPEQPVIFALGPESGWTISEVEQFKALGFYPLSLGPRPLRVEQAFAYLAGQISLMRNQVRK